MRFPTLRHPIVQAPLAGGPSTVALAAAVSGAGGLGFLAAGYRSADAMADEIAELQSQLGGDQPYGVNVFAPPGGPGDPDAVRRYAASLATEAGQAEVTLGTPRWDDDQYEQKLALLSSAAVPVVSFTFGCPASSDLDRLQSRGTSAWVTVTTAAEARQAIGAGADALVVQGVEAGGHRGGFDDDRPGEVGLLTLLQLVRAEVGDVPLVATGGIADGRGVAAVLAAGAVAAQLGTAFLLCPEAGTHPAHREAIARGDAPTALTRAFTGRTARGIENRFLRQHSAGAPSAYPEVHHVTAPLRAGARERGDADSLHLWAGTAYGLARPTPAADLVEQLGDGARTALHEAAERLP